MSDNPEALRQECADFATSLRRAYNVAGLKGKAPPSFLLAADLFERAAAALAQQAATPTDAGLLAALEGLLAIHTEPAGYPGKFGKELDRFLDEQQKKIDAKVIAARAAIAAAQQAATPAPAEPTLRRTTGWVAPKDRYVPPVLFNPYTGEPRDVRDVQSDPQGVLIQPPGAAPLAAPPATPAAQPFEPSADLLVRLRATMVRLGVSTGDEGLEGFGAALGSRLYALCRALEATPAAQPADEREAFEAWCVKRWAGDRDGLTRNASGAYHLGPAEFAWSAWQARAALEGQG